jgi:uncharacterized protein YegP (UPF0339 family)
MPNKIEQGSVEVFKGKGIQPWRFRVRARNGEIIATSEGYLTKWNVKRAVRKAFPTITFVEIG